MGLYISASGILNSFLRNDITANNVANARTTGFRASRPDSVETSTGGVRVGGVTIDNSQGPTEVTGRPLDVSGAGFFQVSRPDGSLAYTRDGSFGLNAQGQVVTQDGSLLQPPIQAPGNATSVVVTRTGGVLATVPGETAPVTLGQLEVFQFANPGGLDSLGGNLFAATPASGLATPALGEAGVFPGTLQGSNVNLTTEITAQVVDRASLQANVNAFRSQDEVLGELLNILG